MRNFHKFVLCFIVLSFVGCATTSKAPQVLSETEQYWYIPKGTPFNAVTVAGEPAHEVIRPNHDTWGVDAGYLSRLQEEANANALNP